MADATNVIHYFSTDIFNKIWVIEGVDGTRKDEILPDKDPIQVTQIIEILVLVKTPAPQPDHIMMRPGGITQALSQHLPGDAGWK